MIFRCFFFFFNRTLSQSEFITIIFPNLPFRPTDVGQLIKTEINIKTKLYAINNEILLINIYLFICKYVYFTFLFYLTLHFILADFTRTKIVHNYNLRRIRVIFVAYFCNKIPAEGIRGGE